MYVSFKEMCLVTVVSKASLTAPRSSLVNLLSCHHCLRTDIVRTSFPAVITTALPVPIRACSMLGLSSHGSFKSMERIDCLQLFLSSRPAFVTGVNPITLSVSCPSLVQPRVRSFCESPLSDNLLRTPAKILRKRGRRMAADAAMIPVPGSAVAQMTALTVVGEMLRPNKRPFRYTMRMMLDMDPTAAKAMTMPTEIFSRRSILLSSRMKIGMRVKIQSAKTFMMP